MSANAEMVTSSYPHRCLIGNVDRDSVRSGQRDMLSAPSQLGQQHCSGQTSEHRNLVLLVRLYEPTGPTGTGSLVSDWNRWVTLHGGVLQLHQRCSPDRVSSRSRYLIRNFLSQELELPAPTRRSLYTIPNTPQPIQKRNAMYCIYYIVHPVYYSLHTSHICYIKCSETYILCLIYSSLHAKCGVLGIVGILDSL